jgi:hypothetical protein
MFIFTLNIHIKRWIYCENCRFMEQHIFIGFSIGLHPLAVMTHLDILVEPKRYDPRSHSRIPTDFYYVASMIRKLDNTGYLES